MTSYTEENVTTNKTGIEPALEYQPPRLTMMSRSQIWEHFSFNETSGMYNCKFCMKLLHGKDFNEMRTHLMRHPTCLKGVLDTEKHKESNEIHNDMTTPLLLGLPENSKPRITDIPSVNFKRDFPLWDEVLQMQELSADVQLICRDGIVPAHAFILQYASSFLDSFFADLGDKFADARVIIISDYDVISVQNAIQLIYTGSTNVSCQEKVDTVMEILDCLCINRNHISLESVPVATQIPLQVPLYEQSFDPVFIGPEVEPELNNESEPIILIKREIIDTSYEEETQVNLEISDIQSMQLQQETTHDELDTEFPNCNIIKSEPMDTNEFEATDIFINSSITAQSPAPATTTSYEPKPGPSHANNRPTSSRTRPARKSKTKSSVTIKSDDEEYAMLSSESPSEEDSETDPEFTISTEDEELELQEEKEARKAEQKLKTASASALYLKSLANIKQQAKMRAQAQAKSNQIGGRRYDNRRRLWGSHPGASGQPNPIASATATLKALSNRLPMSMVPSARIQQGKGQLVINSRVAPDPFKRNSIPGLDIRAESNFLRGSTIPGISGDSSFMRGNPELEITPTKMPLPLPVSSAISPIPAATIRRNGPKTRQQRTTRQRPLRNSSITSMESTFKDILSKINPNPPTANVNPNVKINEGLQGIKIKTSHAQRPLTNSGGVRPPVVIPIPTLSSTQMEIRKIPLPNDAFRDGESSSTTVSALSPSRKYFGNPELFREHAKVCGKCHRKYSHIKEAADCILSHKLVRCYFCFELFPNTEVLFSHYSQTHGSRCPICNDSVMFQHASMHAIGKHLFENVDRCTIEYNRNVPTRNVNSK